MLETGIAMWCLVAVAFVLIFIYILCNAVKLRRRRKAEAAKPQLIITRGYTRR